MTIDELIKEFSPAGRLFINWFTETYQLKKEHYDKAPLEARILALNKFLGYELSVKDGRNLEYHKNLALSRIDLYNKSLNSNLNIITFEEELFNLDRNKIFEMFENEKKDLAYKTTIKDALKPLDKKEYKYSSYDMTKQEEQDEDSFWDELKSIGNSSSLSINKDAPF